MTTCVLAAPLPRLHSYGKGRSSQAGREAEGQLLSSRAAPRAEGHLGRAGAASPIAETLLGLRGMFMGTRPQGRAGCSPASFTSAGTQHDGAEQQEKNISTFVFCGFK